MARTTLSELRGILRGMVQAGTADFSLGTANYWDDDQLDVVLDQNRKDYTHVQMIPEPTVGVGGTSLWYEYGATDDYLEQTSGGSAIFYIQDGTGATVGTAEWSADYIRGDIEFTTDKGGSVFYWTGRSYDLNAAAANIWRKKAGYYFNSFSFSTDNHKVDRGVIYKHCIEMAESFEAKSQDSVVTVDVWRSDTDVI
jgi:hypothetical protein